VLFPDAQAVQDLRNGIAGGGGKFPAIICARRLQRAFRKLVLGNPFHFHAGERMVHLGSTKEIRGATGELKDHVASKVCAVANGTRSDWRVAHGECEAFEAEIAAELGANKTEPKKAAFWRDALIRTVRSEHARTNKRNKAIISPAIRRFLARAKRCRRALGGGVRRSEAAGTDRAGMAKTANAKVEVTSVERGAKRSQSGKRKQISPATRAAQALKSYHPRVSVVGMIDLSKSPTKVVLVEEYKHAETSLPPLAAQ
jgi:hypothetical protein